MTLPGPKVPERLSPADLLALEKMIDKDGLDAVVESLGRICHEKAEHVRSYQDAEYLAQRWEAAGNKLNAMDFREVS